MKNILFSVMIVLFLIGCEEIDNEKIQLNGIWIENSQRMDSLVFDNQGSEGLFILNRERKLMNGYLLPIEFAGPYNYNINGDSINLKYSFSGCFESNNNYYFLLDKDNETLKIGNFFEDSLNNNVVFTFLKE